MQSQPRVHVSGLLLCAAVLTLSAPLASRAVPPAPDAAEAPAQAVDLDAMTVSATLSPRALHEVAADVSIVTREQMDRRMVSSLTDLVRYEPGVVATRSAGRWGESGFSIRGLGGNRVGIFVDGVPVADAFSFGSLLSSGRNAVDLDSVARVEIVRGPASSLYGSDALGGVVSYTTRNPADFLRDGRPWHAAVKGQYDAADRTWTQGVTLAGASGGHGLMLLGTHREGHELDNRGDVHSTDASRTRPDPQRRRSDNALLKYVHEAASGREDRLVVEAQDSRASTDAWSARQGPTLDLRGRDRSRRERVGGGQHWDGGAAPWGADRLEWQAWTQRSDARQRSFELRASGPGYERHVEQRFRQRGSGASLHWFRAWETGAARHELTLGAEATRMRTEELRDGYAINLADGSVSKTTAGGNADNYPHRDFQPAVTTNMAVFAQDELSLADGRLRLIPGVRIDAYRFAPRADALFASQPLSEHVGGRRLTHVSPKFGVVWQATDVYNLYAQYAEGFRAPPYSDLGMLFANLQHGYANIPNPRLKPEISRGAELGLRGEGHAGRFTIAVYANRYRDFIKSSHTLERGDWPEWALDTPGLALLFQSVNLTRAKIHGVEASARLYLDALHPALAGWTLQAGASSARGDMRVEPGSPSRPLDSIAPARLTLGLALERERWGLEVHAAGVRRKHRLATADSFRAPGYATVDFYAHWRPRPQLELFAGLTNLANRRYWDWGSLHDGALGNSAQATGTIDRFSAPGRAASLSARWTF